ncbi:MULTISPECIES: hypothetical protein [unclassified Calothrix]|nr:MULTISPECIES: hypothetical protein [unclassified Calothrix]
MTTAPLQYALVVTTENHRRSHDLFFNSQYALVVTTFLYFFGSHH